MKRSSGITWFLSDLLTGRKLASGRAAVLRRLAERQLSPTGFMGRETARLHPVKTQAKMRGQVVPTPVASSSERGSAVLIILIVVSLMLSFMLANSKSLRHLKEEMRLIEQHQLQQLKQSRDLPASKPAGATNSVPGQPVKTVPLSRQP